MWWFCLVFYGYGIGFIWLVVIGWVDCGVVCDDALLLVGLITFVG